MKKSIKYSGILIIVIIVIVCFLYINDNIGTNKSRLENDARSSQKINDGWSVAKDTTNTMSAMIFYSDDLADHTFSVYVNRHGFSSGYFFRAGGSISEIEKHVAEIRIDGYDERAFVSMNKQHISKIEIDNGNSVQTIDIDSEKPFAVILPLNSGNITIYDVDRNVIESILHKI